MRPYSKFRLINSRRADQADRGGPGQVRFFAGDALKLALAFARERGAGARRFGAVLLDPPREGARGIGPALRALDVPRVVYVSCDPATLARDVRGCVEAGYRVGAVVPVDMFPQTHHVEAVVLLGILKAGGTYVMMNPATTATQAFGKIDPKALNVIQNWPGVRRADTLRAVIVDSPSGPVHVDAINNPDLGSVRLFIWAEGTPEAMWMLMQNDAVIVSEPFAVAYGQEALLHAMEVGQTQFDAAAVEAIDSSGIQLLLALQRSLRINQVALTLTTPSAVLTDALRLYGLGALVQPPH